MPRNILSVFFYGDISCKISLEYSRINYRDISEKPTTERRRKLQIEMR